MDLSEIKSGRVLEFSGDSGVVQDGEGEIFPLLAPGRSLRLGELIVFRVNRVSAEEQMAEVWDEHTAAAVAEEAQAAAVAEEAQMGVPRPDAQG